MRNRGRVWRYCVTMLAGIALAVVLFSGANGGLREQYGDGLWHDIGGGWQYRYVSSIDGGYWLSSGVVRFSFDYDPGQWWHHGTTWTTLSGTGLLEGDWVGDGAWHNINNNGWSYRYITSISSGYWNTGGATRFGYDYGGLQWWDCRTQWLKLGGSGISELFVGDGVWHGDLVNGWSYRYVISINSGYWKTGGATRFGYDYGAGQWWDCRTQWLPLGGSSLSQAFIGDGAWHSGLVNGWSYTYVTSISGGYWNNGSATRFSYDYNAGQWWDYSTSGSWLPLGASSLSQAFVGDGAWHSGLVNGWWYQYITSTSRGYWNTGGATRFSYDYNVGQWWDQIGTGWGCLGPSGISQVFIGDGSLHLFTTNDWFRYTGSYYYWLAGNLPYYRYDYVNQVWQKYFSSAWQNLNASYENSDVRYIGNHRFVESSLRPDTGTDAPSGYKNIIYDYYIVNEAAYQWRTHVTWAIKNPGSDGIWSAGNLNVVFCNTLDPNTLQYTDFHQAWGEYGIEDTVVFTADMEHIGLGSMVDWLQIVRDYYHDQIFTVAFKAHGNSTGWEIGSWIDTSNYNTSANIALFERWGTYMSTDGQILSYHCEVGQAATMLDAIAQWTGADVFANTDTVWTWWTWVKSPYQFDSTVWNYNMRNLRWRTEDGGSLDTFEYMSNPGLTYHQIFEERAW